MGVNRVRVPVAFRIYYIVMGVVKLASIVRMFLVQGLDVVSESYGPLGLGLLFYQIFSYIMLILTPFSKLFLESILVIVPMVVLSELSLLVYSAFNASTSVTLGYLVFTVVNIMVLILSIVAASLYPLNSNGQRE